MIKIKTKVGEILLINNRINKTFEEIFTIPGLEKRFKYLGELSGLDKELEEFVDKSLPLPLTEKSNWYYKDYTNTTCLLNIKESFISLIKSQYPDFEENNEYLLIKIL